MTATKLSLLQEVPICGKNYEIEDDITFAELLDYPIISLGTGTSTFEFYFEESLKHNRNFSPDIEAATADQIVPPLVKHGLGIGFVPEQFLAEEEDVCAISLSKPLPTREIVLVKKKGHVLPLPAKELVDMINQEFIFRNCEDKGK